MGIGTVIPSTVRLQRKMQNFQVSKLLTYLLLFFSILDLTLGYASLGQEILASPQAVSCDPFTPTPQHPVPGKKPFSINETVNYYEHYVNGSQNGEYRRSSCPGLNMLANRGYLNRSGKNVTMAELVQAFTEVFNFGIDNVSLLSKIVLAAKAGHGTVLKTTQCDSDEEIEE